MLHPSIKSINTDSIYNSLTTNLIKDKSIKLRDRFQIDITRPVVISSHAIAAAHAWEIPLKDPNNSHSVGFTPNQLYEAMSNVFSYVFFDGDTTRTLTYQHKARQSAVALAAAVSSSRTNSLGGQFSFLTRYFSSLKHKLGANTFPEFGTKLIQNLLDSGMPMDQVVWTIVPASSAGPPIQTQGITLLLEFYLSPNNARHWADIQALAMSDSPDSLERLRKYALEGLRLNPPAAGAFRINAAPNTLTSRDRSSIHPGERNTVLVDLKSAGIDATVFHDPLEVKLDRKDSLYAYLGYSEHLFLEQNTMMKIMAAQLGVFARLKNLRRAAGPPGELKSTTVNGTLRLYISEDWSHWAPFPSTWKLYYDE